MSIASELRQQRTRFEALRNRLQQGEQSAIDFRMLHATLEERVDRQVREAPPVRTDEAIAEHMDRVWRRRTSGARRLEALERHAARPGVFGKQLRESWARMVGTEAADAVEGISNEELFGYDAEAVQNWSRDDFNAVSHAFITLFVAALRERREDERAAEGVVKAYHRDAGNLATAQPAARSLLGLLGLLQSAVDSIREDLNQLRAEHVATLDDAHDQSVDPLQALEWEDPVALLPVRLETRFDEEARRLVVRVYPDQVHIDSHEEPLTEAEHAWGTAFWAQLWFAALPTNPAGEPTGAASDIYRDPATLPNEWSLTVVEALFEQYPSELSYEPGIRFDEVRERAWAQGVERFGEERAAHALHALSPEHNGDLGAQLLKGWRDGRAPIGSVIDLRFPDVDLRPESWMQTPQAQLLPDRFVGYAYYPARDGRDETTPWTDRADGSQTRRIGKEHVIRFAGSAVREPLPVGPNPEVVAAGDAAPAFNWMLDFDEAVRAGMGMAIDLPSDADGEATQRFSRVVVTGVRTSMDAEGTARALEQQFDAAHYTSGLELLAPGTPTNNADVPAGRTSRPRASDTARVEAGAPRVTSDSPPGRDGRRLARALGIAPKPFAHIAGAGDTLDEDAEAINTLLWPATLGYFAANLWVDAGARVRLDNGRRVEEEPSLEHLMWLESYHNHFVEHVRAGGPFPLLRVGAQPYGVLPVTPYHVSLEDVPTFTPDTVPASGPASKYGTVPLIEDVEFVPDLMRRIESLSAMWSASAKAIPSVGEDPAMSDEDLLRMLSQEATARTYRRRMWLLDDSHPLLSWLDLTGLEPEQTGAVLKALEEAGVRPPWTPRIARLLHLGFVFDGDDVAVSDDPSDFLELLDAVLPLRDDFSLVRLIGATGLDDTIQKQILRLAIVQAVVAARVRVGAIYSDYADLPPEPLQYPIDPAPFRSSLGTLFDALEDHIPDTTPRHGGARLVDHPDLHGANTNGNTDPSTYEEMLKVVAREVRSGTDPSQTPDPVFARQVMALRRLKERDAERLDRLFRGTMDLASHRLDAWWTSVATRQLWALRDRQAASTGAGHAPGGVYVGAFGIVENLEPGSGPDAEYLLAPSMDQATTAAVLRTAYKSRVQEDNAAAEPLAVDLSSDRVQAARTLLRGVRRGLTLAELLGYRFERALHEKSGGDLNLEAYIHDYRALAPAVEGKLERGSTDPKTKKSDVVDGLALHRMWKEEDLNDDFVTAQDEREAIAAIFEEIDVSLDAVHDVLMAEGVHHLIHGRPERAAAALEALSRGGAAPEDVQVLETPRTETSVTHRLAVLFGDADADAVPPAWQPAQPPLLTVEEVTGTAPSGAPEIHARASAEPNLNAWIGSMLPAPGRIGCTGTFQWSRERSFATGSFTVPDRPGVVTVQEVGFEPTLIELTIAPGAEAGEPKTTGVSGWVHGVYRGAAAPVEERQQSVFALVDADGAVETGSTGTSCLLAREPGAQRSGELHATIRGTTSDGFEVAFHVVDAAPNSVVHYRATRLADPTSVRVGLVAVPPTASPVTVDLSEDVGDDFSPDHVTFTSVCGGDGSGTAGFSSGDALRQKPATAYQVVGATLDPTGASSRAVARDDAVVYALGGTGAGAGMKASVSGFDQEDASITLQFEAPSGAAYAAGLVAYVAYESPTSEQEGTRTVHHPAIGQVTGPSAEGETVGVTLGFRPGRVEVVVTGALTGDGGDLPIEVVPGPGASYAYGAASSAVVQGSVGIGQTSSDFSASASTHRVAVLLSENSDGVPVEGTTVRLAGLTDEGFDLAFPTLDPAHHHLRVFYRAMPAEPSEQAFAASTSVRLSDLNLTPLDAVALTQGVAEAGDSQLERRIGYHCFRHPPESRPPVPGDALLDLSFQVASANADGADADVSMATHIEVAAAVRDVVGEGRPADARDLAHPGEAGNRGYTDATAAGLKDRADRVAETAHEARTIIQNRIDLLTRAPNVCEQIDAVVHALTEAVQSVPFRQIIDVCSLLDEEHPDGPHGETEGTILAELREIANRLQAGPVEEVDLSEDAADVLVQAGEQQTLTLPTDISPGTTVDVRIRSYTDAVHFNAQASTATVQQDESENATRGAVSVPFDTREIPAGSAATIMIIPPAAKETLTDVLSRLMEEQSQDVVQRVLGLLEDDGWLAAHKPNLIEDYFRLPADLRRHVWAALHRGGKYLALDQIGREDVIERWENVERTLTEIVVELAFSVDLDIQVQLLEALAVRDLLDGFQRGHLSDYRDLEEDVQRHIWVSLSKEARITLLEALGEEALADDYRGSDEAAECLSGRVIDAVDGGMWRDLPRYLREEAVFVPALLWLHRILPGLKGGEGATLQAAVGVADEAAIQTEVALMGKVPDLYRRSAPGQRVFTESDARAAEAIRDLLALDLVSVAEQIERACEPLVWSGLTALITVTGSPFRPSAQRYWRSGGSDLTRIVEKHVEGEVRSRLERILGMPQLDGRAVLGGYSLPMRTFVQDAGITAEFLEELEALLRNPVAAARALSGHLSDPHAAVHDLHDAMHHIEAYLESRTALDLHTHLSELRLAIDRGNLKKEDLAPVVGRTPDALFAGRDKLAEALPDAIRDYAGGARPDPAQATQHFLSGVSTALEELSVGAREQMGDMILLAAAFPRPAWSFRAGVLEGLRQGLLRASYLGVYGSTPASAAGGHPDDESTLVGQARSVVEELDARIARARQADPSPPTVEGQVARIQELLGDSFVVLPPFAPVNAREVHATFASSSRLLGEDVYAPDTWLQRIARIREKPEAFQQLRTYADALGFAAADGRAGRLRRTLTVGQIPHGSNAWLGRDGIRPSGGEVAFGVEMVQPYTAEEPLPDTPGQGGQPLIAGLFIDEWVEAVPAPEETIGLGIQYDDPSTRAPQSVLLAVPPSWVQNNEGISFVGPAYWTDAALRQAMAETMEWIRRRTVDAEALQRLGHVLPALFFPHNMATRRRPGLSLPDAPSVDFSDLNW